jgi:hypothetical protein
VREVEPKDFEVIAEWRKERGAPPLGQWFYPKYGLIQAELAAGWLMRTDSNTAILEHWITNPKADVADRTWAMFAIASALERKAVTEGFTYVITISTVEGLNEACKRAGFKELGAAMMLGKEL